MGTDVWEECTCQAVMNTNEVITNIHFCCISWDNDKGADFLVLNNITEDSPYRNPDVILFVCREQSSRTHTISKIIKELRYSTCNHRQILFSNSRIFQLYIRLSKKVNGIVTLHIRLTKVYELCPSLFGIEFNITSKLVMKLIYNFILHTHTHTHTHTHIYIYIYIYTL